MNFLLIFSIPQFDVGSCSKNLDFWRLCREGNYQGIWIKLSFSFRCWYLPSVLITFELTTKGYQVSVALWDGMCITGCVSEHWFRISLLLNASPGRALWTISVWILSPLPALRARWFTRSSTWPGNWRQSGGGAEDRGAAWWDGVACGFSPCCVTFFCFLKRATVINWSTVCM